MLISPQHLSPGSLVTLQRTQATASSGFCFICPNVRATLPFSLLPPPPRTQRQVTKLNWGQSASLTKAPCNRCHIAQLPWIRRWRVSFGHCFPLPSSVAPARPLVGPGPRPRGWVPHWW